LIKTDALRFLKFRFESNTFIQKELCTPYSLLTNDWEMGALRLAIVKCEKPVPLSTRFYGCDSKNLSNHTLPSLYVSEVFNYSDSKATLRITSLAALKKFSCCNRSLLIFVRNLFLSQTIC